MKINFFKNFLDKINGNAEYKKYLKHFKHHHHGDKALSKQEFFAKKEQEKWGKINRCC